jgi:hypothetical protein
MRKLFKRVDINTIFWFFLNHGSDDSLVLDQSKLSVPDFKWIFRAGAPGIATKDLFIVLDSCWSGEFVRRAVIQELGPAHMWVLTSSPGPCATSAIIVSDDRSLLNCLDPDDPNSVCYSVQAPMMTRELLHLIFYTDENPSLSELPGLLNRLVRQGNGFEAEFHEKNPSDLTPRLREFFGPGVNPDDFVDMGGSQHELRLILPPISEPDGLFDDFKLCSRHLTSLEDHGYVRVIKEGPNGFKVTGYGKLGLNPGDKAILDHLSQFRSERGFEPRAPIHVSLGKLITAALAEVRKTQTNARDPKDKRTTMLEINRVITEVNGYMRSEAMGLFAFAPYWHLHTPAEWRMEIKKAQDEMLKQPTSG